MQTQFDDQVRRTALGARAEEIIQKCVHCGFCNVTCPTYNVLGDELDGPRGRVLAHAFLKVGLMNPDNQIVILLPGQFRMQNSKPIPSGA